MFQPDRGNFPADCGNSTNAFIHHIYDAADASVLASSCPTIWGDLVIMPDASGDIDLDGVTNITGNLQTVNLAGNFPTTGITSIHSRTLRQMGGLDIYSVPLLQNISFPNLESIAGDGQIYIGNALELSLIDLSSIQTGGEFIQIFSTPSLTNYKYPMNVSLAPTTWGIVIAGTGLTSINGFTDNPGGISFYDNPNLKEVSLQINETTEAYFLPQPFRAGSIAIRNSSDAVRINFPFLAAVASWIALDNPSELSIPALSIVNGSFTVTNASFKSLSAPNLEFINGSLNITGSFSG